MQHAGKPRIRLMLLS